MDAIRLFRRREGVVDWGLFRDAADPDHYVETFLVLTWGEHMRQHVRVTVEDQAIEAHAFSYPQESVQPFTSHLIDARTFDTRAFDAQVLDGGTSEEVSRTELPYMIYFEGGFGTELQSLIYHRIQGS